MRLGYHISFFHAHFEFFSGVFLECQGKTEIQANIFLAKCYCRTLVDVYFASCVCVCVLFFFKAESSGIVYCVLSLFGAIGPNSPFTVAVTQNNSTEITAVSPT